MSNYFNLGKFAVEKGPKLVKTVVSPIKQAANVIRTTFAKPKKPKIGGQEKSKKIKEAVGIKLKVCLLLKEKWMNTQNFILKFQNQMFQCM